MTIIYETEPNTESTVYSIQMYVNDTGRWSTIADISNEWEAHEIYKEWSEHTTNIYRIIAISYKVDILESEVPEFN